MHPAAFTFPEHLDVDLAGLIAAAHPWVAQLNVRDLRVQSSPDARNVRFYQTTGLLARPLRYDGRVARYGVRHLLQLIAIRALQAQGMSLSQVQVAFTGISDIELQQIIANAIGAKWPDRTRTTAPTSRPNAHASTAVASSALVAVEIAPGVIVTIDSTVCADVDRTVSALRRALIDSETPTRKRTLP